MIDNDVKASTVDSLLVPRAAPSMAKIPNAKSGPNKVGVVARHICECSS